jgi:hypothetical protein
MLDRFIRPARVALPGLRCATSGLRIFRRVGAALLLAAGSAGIVSAHTQTGTLGADASATDLYLVTCDDNGNGQPAYLIAQVLDSAPKAAPLLSVLASKESQAVNSTDTVDGDSSFSPLVKVEGGRGNYLVAVTKTKKGQEAYILQYHCHTPSDVETGTEIVTLQNQ